MRLALLVAVGALAAPSSASANLPMTTAKAAAADVLADAGPTAKLDRCRRTSGTRIVCVGGWTDWECHYRQRLVVRELEGVGRVATILVSAGDARCRPRIRRSGSG